MTEAQTDIYVRGYNQGRADEAAHKTTKGDTGMFKTPDVTPVQFTGIVAAVVTTALAFGVDLSDMQQHVLLADAAVVGSLLFGDAVIRHGRATGNAKKDG